MLVDLPYQKFQRTTVGLKAGDLCQQFKSTRENGPRKVTPQVIITDGRAIADFFLCHLIRKAIARTAGVSSHCWARDADA